MLRNIQLDSGTLHLVTRYMAPFTKFLESTTGILGQVFGQMHKNYLRKLDSCMCSGARILFFQELLQRLSEANFSFEKNESTSVTFIPFCINDLFTLKIESANMIILTTKQCFEIGEMSSTTLDVGLILGYKGRIAEVNFFNKNLFLLSAPSVEGLLFHLQKMTIFNCDEKPICISAGQDLCTFVLNSKSEHLVLTQVEDRNLGSWSRIYFRCRLLTTGQAGV